MPHRGDIYLGEIGTEFLLSPFGRRLKISDTELFRQERTASGRLVKEIIAVKKKFELSYESIDGAALEKLLNIYDIGDELSLILYNNAMTSTTEEGESYTVLMEPLDRERVLLMGDGLWSGVNVVLNEV